MTIYSFGMFDDGKFIQAAAVDAPDDGAALLCCFDFDLSNVSEIAVWHADKVVFAGPIARGRRSSMRIKAFRALRFKE